jgi:hypothetical protein
MLERLNRSTIIYLSCVACQLTSNTLAFGYKLNAKMRRLARATPDLEAAVVPVQSTPELAFALRA